MQGEESSERKDWSETPTTALAPLTSLAPFRLTAEGRDVERLEDRLRTDTELVARLMLGGYKGPDWDAAATRLVAYGHRVVRAWILDGTIVLECQAKGWPVEWSGLCRIPEVATDIATMVVAVALRHFRDDVLVPGKWDPGRGASLSTYFVGQCLLRYANEYRTWRRSYQRSTRGDDAARWDREPLVPDIAGQVADGAAIAEHLNAADPTTGRALRLRAADYSWEEIAELTGMSGAAIRGRVSRFQAKARQRRDAS